MAGHHYGGSWLDKCRGKIAGKAVPVTTTKSQTQIRKIKGSAETALGRSQVIKTTRRTGTIVGSAETGWGDHK